MEKDAEKAREIVQEPLKAIVKKLPPTKITDEGVQVDVDIHELISRIKEALSQARSEGYVDGIEEGLKRGWNSAIAKAVNVAAELDKAIQIQRAELFNSGYVLACQRIAEKLSALKKEG